MTRVFEPFRYSEGKPYIYISAKLQKGVVLVFFFMKKILIQNELENKDIIFLKTILSSLAAA